MPPSKSRFVTACQQVLALGVVLAALTPAASVINLDVVREHPSAAAGGVPPGAVAAFAAYTARLGEALAGPDHDGGLRRSTPTR